MENASSEFDASETKSSDMAFLSYTSGTTGHQKELSIHMLGDMPIYERQERSWLGIEEEDVVWATAAPGWQKWIWTPFLSVLGSGATGLVYDGKFDVKTYFELN